MSNVGYRNTAPAKVFLASSIEELRGIETSMVGYKDIYDLENTLLSFEYTPGDAAGGKSGRTKFRLVNPTRNVENVLFSIYKAMQPRAQTPINGENEDKELSKNLDVANTSYVRWGYMSEDPDTKEPVTRALSEIHKMRLIEVDYDINNNQDRIITINFVDSLDLDYRGMMTEQSEGEGELITFPIHNSDYKLRKMSSMVQELILRCLNGTSEYELLGRFSDEQETAINETLDALIAKQCLKDTVVTKEQKVSIKEEGHAAFDHVGFQLSEANFLPVNGEKFNYVQDKSPFEIPLMMAVCNYMSDLLGGRANFRTASEDDFGPNSITSKGQDSLNRGANNNNGSPDEPNPQGTDQASSQAQAAALKSKYPILPIGESDWNALSMPPVLPTPPPWACMVPYYVAKELPDKFQVDFTPLEMKQILKEGKALLISAAAWKVAEGKSKGDQQTMVAVPMPAGPWEGDFPPTDARLFDLQNHKTVLELQADTEHAKNLEAAAQLADDTTPTMQENADAISENEPATTTKPPPVSKSHMAEFKGDANMILRCKGYIDRINATILAPVAPLINMVKLEYSTVPEDERPHVESVLGRTLDWENFSGAIIIGDNKFFMRLYSWRRDINSFPIEVEDDDGLVKRISLATGFSQRKDNIILNVGFKQDQAFLATALRQSPIINQKLYSISKRFSDPAYRDVVAQQLTLKPTKGEAAGAAAGKKVGEAAAETEAQTPVAALEPKELPIGVLLPMETADKAIAAAARYSSEEGNTDTKDTQKMREQVAADLRWITNNKFLDVFFPKTTFPGQHDTPLSIKGEPDNIASSRYYRTIAASPLTNLQTFTNSSTDSEAVLLASKMGVLRQLQAALRQVDVTTLGVPEMDILDNEIARRNVGLWVAEPRTPGSFHWMTGVYLIRGFTHKIDSNGYTMTMSLFPKQPQVAEDLRKFQYAFLKD